jgi:serine/threonine protein kinase
VLHNAGYIHLDLKPRNIVLMTDVLNSENSSTLSLIDFGISQTYRMQNGQHKIFSTGIAQSGSAFFSSKYAFNGYCKPHTYLVLE